MLEIDSGLRGDIGEKLSARRGRAASVHIHWRALPVYGNSDNTDSSVSSSGIPAAFVATMIEPSSDPQQQVAANSEKGISAVGGDKKGPERTPALV